MTKSFAVSPFTMPAALAAANPVLTPVGVCVDQIEWQTARHWPPAPNQVEFLRHFRHRADLASRLPQIRSSATESPMFHAAWLRAQGWDSQVTTCSPGDLLLAATLDVGGMWQEEGIPYRANSINRVLLKRGARASYREAGKHEVVHVATQTTGVTFIFWQPDEKWLPENNEDLMHYARNMTFTRTNTDVYLDFPAVNLRHTENASYMLGLRSGPNVVSQAAEQLRLELDHRGGRACAAAEVSVSRSISMNPTVRIDGPFIVAVRVESLPPEDQVVFAAFCAPDSWCRPSGRSA